MACWKEESGQSDQEGSADQSADGSFLCVKGEEGADSRQSGVNERKQSSTQDNRSDAISPKVADVLEKVMSSESGLSPEEQQYSTHNQTSNYTHRSQSKEDPGLPILSNIYQNNYCPYPENSFQSKDLDQPRCSPQFNHQLTPNEKYSYRREETDSSALPSTDSSGYKTDEEQPRGHNLFQDSFKSDPGTPLPRSYYGDRLSKDHTELSEESFRRKDDPDSNEYAPGKLGERTPDRSLSREDDGRDAELSHNGSYSHEQEEANTPHLNSSLNDSYQSEDDSSDAIKLGLNESSAEHLLPEDYKNYSYIGSNPLASPSYGRRYGLVPIPRTQDPTSETYHTPQKKSGLYFCHLCSFSAKFKEDFDAHMGIHFEYSCPHCDYTSRTEGRLKRHIKDFHSSDSEGFGTAKMQRMQPGRPKVYRCKQCSFASTTKIDFWQHSRTHIKEEKLLQCPRCPFVTEYKHHLEYHLRNHFGSKPFKCTKCNYSCVNKSMLNSHMKSHTNVYQYRCADCTYATKYCHSLKLHLKKYNHKPAAVLNADGSLPQGLEPEASGLSLLAKRGPPRGPRGPRKDKMDGFMSPLFHLPQSPMAGMPPGLNGALMSPYWPLLNQLPNGIHHPPPLIPVNNMSGQMKFPQQSTPEKIHKQEPGTVKCNLCSFSSDSPEGLNAHVLKVHAAGENQDLFNMFGISSDALLDEQNLKASIAAHHQMSREGLGLHLSRANSNMLHVQTDSPSISSKTSPQSWSGNHRLPSSNNKGHIEQTYPRNDNKDSASPIEGADILKQMTLKFGGGESPRIRKESPLDLTKPKSVSPPADSSPYSIPPQNTRLPQISLKRPCPDSISNDSSIEQVASPRKRSRKGKAYKLDTLCLKLQEKQTGSPYESESEDSGSEVPTQEYVTETRVDEASPNGREESPGSLKIDEMKYSSKHNDNEDEDDLTKNGSSPILHKNDFEQIHENLKILNSGIKSEPSESANGESIFEDKNGCLNPDDESKANLSREDVENYLHPQKAVPSALRRGAELAWKILNDSTANGDAAEEVSSNGVVQEGQGDKPTTLPHPLALASLGSKGKPFRGADSFECHYCEIAFRDCVMYTMHMGYHGYQDPYKCNMCGHCSRDKVEFFLHIARAAHS